MEKESNEKPEFNESQIFRMKELYEDYKFFKGRYIQVMDDKRKFNRFCNTYRSPIFDLQFLKTGLISEAAKLVPKNETTADHYFNRKLSTKLVYDEMLKYPTFEEFILILKKYGSTIIITKEEHSRFKKDAQGMYLKTYRDYEDRGIDVPGLKEYSKSLGH
jgi:ribosomal protein S18